MNEKKIITDVNAFCSSLEQLIPLHELHEAKHRLALNRYCENLPFFVVFSTLPQFVPFYICPKSLAYTGIKPGEVSRLGMTFFSRILHVNNLHIVHEGIKHFTLTPDDYFINTYCINSLKHGWRWVYGCSKTITKDAKGKSANLIISVFYDVEQLLNMRPAIVPDQEISAPGNTKVEELTQRENEVMDLLARGVEFSKAAGSLNISEHTFITHKKNLMKKLGVKRIADLVRMAVNKGGATNLP